MLTQQVIWRIDKGANRICSRVMHPTVQYCAESHKGGSNMSEEQESKSPVSRSQFIKEDEMAEEKEVSRKLSRKDFVKGAAAVAGVGALAGCAPAATPAPECPAAPTCPPAAESPPCSFPEVPETWDEEVDVLVVGTGAAGLSAAVTASESGAEVLVLEQYEALRGLLGRISAAGTKMQEADGIQDSAELFYEDWMKAGNYKPDPELVRIAAEQSNDAIEWLMSYGTEYKSVKLGEGATVPRSHMGGADMAGGLLAAALEKSGGRIMFSTRLTRLIRERYMEGRVVGARAVGEDGKELTIKAKKAVIVATGRWRNDAAMLLEHWPALPTAQLQPAVFGESGEWGDVIREGLRIGASMRHMAYINLSPYSSMIEGVAGSGIVKAPQELWVNLEGQRVTDESSLRGALGEAALAQPDATYFSILDSNPDVLLLYLKDTMEEIDTWVNEGSIIRANTIEELAEGLEQKWGVPADAVVQTVAKYNEYCETGVDVEFNKPKESLVKLELPPFYSGPPYTCKVAMTVGGFSANAEAQARDMEGEVIPGLYAAGMCCGGHHGQDSVMGNYQVDAVVFGRTAGKNAAAETV